MEKKRSKKKEKKDLFRIASMFVMILLLPLLLTLMYEGYKQVIIPFLHPISIKEQKIFIMIIFGIPLSLIIAYGYITKEKITSTLSGFFLNLLSYFYSDILFGGLFDPYFVTRWLRWTYILDFIPVMLICGLAGYFASRGTKVSLLIAIIFGVLFIFIMQGVGR